VQFGLRVAWSCGIAARAQAVVRRDGRPGRWCWWSAERGRVGCRAAALKAPSAECIEILCRVGDEVFLMPVVGIVWCNSFRGLASSSLLERLVFAPPIA
jgi:hypothetical protein